MIRRNLMKLSVVAMVATQVLTVAPASVGAQAGGADTYVSQTYGYRLTYDASWEVAGQSSENGVDALTLRDDPASVTVLGSTGFGGDPSDCVDGLSEEFVLNGPGYSSVALKMEGTEGPTSAYAIYDYTYTFDNGTSQPFTDILQCETLVPGQSGVAFWQSTPASASKASLAPFNALVAGLTTPEVSATTAGEPNDAGTGELSATDSVLALGGELDGFWTEQFASAGDYYIRPFYDAVEENIETACDAPVLASAVSSADAIQPGTSSMYCGLDQTVYLDVLDVQAAMDLGGPAAFVYTLAHEVGHHVQMQMGLSWEERSVVTELQADCFAGAFIADARARGLVTQDEVLALEPLVVSYGDSTEMTVDDPFSHGEGTQRWSMFLRGYSMGASGVAVLDACSM